MNELKLVYKKVCDILPYEKNPRRNDEAVEAVASSIEKFGFKVPVIIDCNNIIVAGHTRIKAAKQLGIEKIPCICADDLNEQQIKAFRLVDNKVSEFAEWDMDLLLDELDDITDIDMEELGFISNDDYNIDDFFVKQEQQEKKEHSSKKHIKCPHCGKEIEI